MGCLISCLPFVCTFSRGNVEDKAQAIYEHGIKIFNSSNKCCCFRTSTSKRIDKAVKRLFQAAQLGSVNAQFLVGKLSMNYLQNRVYLAPYSQGKFDYENNGTLVDVLSVALEMLGKASDSGHREAKEILDNYNNEKRYEAIRGIYGEKTPLMRTYLSSECTPLIKVDPIFKEGLTDGLLN